MITINRTAIMVRPGQPFLDWLHRADATSSELSLGDLRREPTVYLLPECENEGEARKCLKEVCSQIFEEQLDGRYRVPSSRPGRRDLDVFDSLVRVEFPLGGGRSLRRTAAPRGELSRKASFCGPNWRRFEFLDITLQGR
jgi:hypothetical protein